MKSKRIEEKQETLKKIDPEKEERLSEMFVDYIGSLYQDMGITRQERSTGMDEALAAYERTLDDAIRDAS